MSRSYISSCPRCGSRTYENLVTHSHCFDCLYSSEFEQVHIQDIMTMKEAEAFLREADAEKARAETKVERALEPAL